MENILLSIKNLRKSFSSQKAVDDISFDIPKGKIFGLLGPNGAGKSTLLRMITGIFYPDSGQILMNGHPINGLDTEFMGYMPEERGLYKKMKVGEHILYLAQLKGMSKKDAKIKCHEWFQRMGMETWWDKKVSDLSKGMSQKVQFVGTVVHEPKLLILDEPFSGLDPVNSEVLKKEIFRLANEGTTIIFSTHRMEQVEEFCDQIVLVNMGLKILDGKVSEIKQNFKENIYQIKFADSIDQLPEGLMVREKDEHQLIFQLKEEEEPNKILEFFIQKGKRITSFQEILPSLNEIFIRLVKQNSTPDARVFNN